MDLDRLRRLAESKAKEKSDEYARWKKQWDDEVLSKKWTEAKEAVANLEQAISAAAKDGRRVARVFRAPKGDGRMGRYPCDDWGKVAFVRRDETIPYTGPIPDYAEFVYRECIKLGLRRDG